MLSYCLMCRKKAESGNPQVVNTKNGRIRICKRARTEQIIKKFSNKETFK